MNTKRLTFVLLLAALLVAAQPLFAQLDEDFGSSSSDWPVPQWTQLTGLLGSTPASGAQWFQDDWLNLANSTNKSAKINIYGSSRNGWLVTAPVAIPDPGFELAFDLGLMAWNRNVAITPGAQPDDRFIVLMSSSPSMANPILLREWNNSGSPHVFDQIPSGGIRISIPLSGVSGNKYFAFYGESTLVNGDNDLMIDNVSINRIPLYPSFSYVPAFLDFGTCRFGMPTAPQLLQITNTGGNILDIIPSDLSISGPDATMFSYDPQVLPVALSSGQSVSIPLVFNPLGVGPRSAILQIVNNQTRSLYEIPLSGVSLPEDIVPIGQGNIDLDMPINPYWGYSYSQSIFLQSEINVPNQQIEKLYFYWNGAANADGSAVRLPARWFEIDPLIQSFPYLVDFEDHADNTLPPGWERSSLSLGWKTGNDLSSDYWSIPPHSIYAAANDDAAGSGANGSMDLLMMPQMDFSASAGSPMLSFDSFYPGDYGQLAKVEASTDGTTWNLVHSLTPNALWTPVSVDLSAYAGLNPVFIRFHSDDSGIWASGWAIDNVCLVFSPGLDTPTLEISFDANGLRLSWNAVDGASTYRVEASPTPLQEDTWTLLTTTTSLSYTYSGTVSPLFFRVSAAATR